MPRPTRGRPLASVNACSISNDALETLKWIGLLLMTADHVNKYLLNEASPALYALGRMVMPLFGFVLMVHLTRPGAFEAGVHLRVMKRMAIFALLATPAFVHLVGWWPLNIMATLFLVTVLVWLLERGSWACRCTAAIAFLFGGAVVEFWWPALLCCLGAWAFLRRRNALRLMLGVLAVASLSIVNGNFAAMVAIPLIWSVCWLPMHMPRSRWVFYTFYPAHLSLITLIKALT